MKFGFDIDDTLINLRQYAFEIYQEQLGFTVATDKFHMLEQVEIHGLFGLSDAEGNQMWNGLLDRLYYTDCPAYPGAVELLQKLKHQGHEIYYLTARPAEHSDGTIKWLRAQGFPVDDSRFYCGMKDHEKVHIIDDLQLDYYFDDKPAVVEPLLSKSLTVVMRDQSYNRHVDLPRITHWDELDSILANSKTR